jgi:hypothetical protein
VTTLGAGHVETWPAGPIFEYGSVTRLVAIPDTGNYFFRWGNSVTGSVSPARLTITNAAPGVSALFSPLGASQASLSVRLEGTGLGTVNLLPVANVFTNGQSLVLTAVPDMDHVFLGWSGAVTGPTNPVTFSIQASTNVTARFAPGLRFDPAQSRLEPGGFWISLKGVPGFVFNLEQSTNLAAWNYVATLTNTTGQLRYQDTRPGVATRPGTFYRVVGP